MFCSISQYRKTLTVNLRFTSLYSSLLCLLRHFVSFYWRWSSRLLLNFARLVFPFTLNSLLWRQRLKIMFVLIITVSTVTRIIKHWGVIISGGYNLTLFTTNYSLSYRGLLFYNHMGCLSSMTVTSFLFGVSRHCCKW